MSRQVQISEELFDNLLNYFFESKWTGADFLAEDIRRQLNSKLDKMIARELFSRYKRTPTGVEREQARQAYLNHRGVLDNFRSDEEWHEPEPPKK